jgi:hypothetical protein
MTRPVALIGRLQGLMAWAALARIAPWMSGPVMTEGTVAAIVGAIKTASLQPRR